MGFLDSEEEKLIQLTLRPGASLYAVFSAFEEDLDSDGNEVPTDISGYHAKSQIRDKDDNLIAEFKASVMPQDEEENPHSNAVSLELTAAQTSGITADEMVSDIQLTNGRSVIYIPLFEIVRRKVVTR